MVNAMWDEGLCNRTGGSVAISCQKAIVLGLFL